MTKKQQVTPGTLTVNHVRALLAIAIETGDRDIVDDCRDWLDCVPYGGRAPIAASNICRAINDPHSRW